MTLQTQLVILALLIVATILEVFGDAIIGIGMGKSTASVRGAYFLAIA